MRARKIKKTYFLRLPTPCALVGSEFNSNKTFLDMVTCRLSVSLTKNYAGVTIFKLKSRDGKRKIIVT